MSMQIRSKIVAKKGETGTITRVMAAAPQSKV
jgi:hypothetical protein